MTRFKVVYYILILVLLGIIISDAYQIYQSKQEQYQIEAQAKINEPNTMNIEDYQQQYQNKDIIGKLTTNFFKTLVVQGSDNEYYLNHLVDKQYNILGSVYIDYRIDIDNSKVIIVYGHSSNEYDLPFNYLHQYLDKSTFENNNLIKLETENQTYQYELVTVKIVNDDNHLQVNFQENQWENHLENLTTGAIYSKNIDEQSEIIILQTCYLNEDNKYLIIIGRKV